MARQSNVVALILGAAALIAGTAAGWSEALNALLLSPAPLIRLVLALTAFVLGFVLLVRSAEQLRHSSEPPELVRGVRIVFLAVAAFAAAGGWIIHSPVPIAAALVIAGVDILETTFLLVVALSRGRP